VAHNLLKDQMATSLDLNSTGLSAGNSTCESKRTADAGIPIPVGWLITDVKYSSGASRRLNRRRQRSIVAHVTGAACLPRSRGQAFQLSLTTRHVPHTKPVNTTPRIESEPRGRNSRRAKSNPRPVAPKAATVPDRKRQRRKFAATPAALCAALRPRWRSMGFQSATAHRARDCTDRHSTTDPARQGE